MNIKTNYAHPSNYNAGRSQAIKYIVMHYTGNVNDTDEGNGKYFAQPNRNASAHYFVDGDSITLSVKESDTAWHCGANTYKHAYCRNPNSIGIEMCSKKDKSTGRYYIDEVTQNNAAGLVRSLMKKYGIRTENVLRHYDVTGKLCPEPFVRKPEQWENFKKRIGEEKIVTIEQAVNILIQKDVINTGEYWENAARCVLYLPELLIKVAEKMK